MIRIARSRIAPPALAPIWGCAASGPPPTVPPPPPCPIAASSIWSASRLAGASAAEAGGVAVKGELVLPGPGWLASSVATGIRKWRPGALIVEVDARFLEGRTFPVRQPVTASWPGSAEIRQVVITCRGQTLASLGLDGGD